MCTLCARLCADSPDNHVCWVALACIPLDAVFDLAVVLTELCMHALQPVASSFVEAAAKPPAPDADIVANGEDSSASVSDVSCNVMLLMHEHPSLRL